MAKPKPITKEMVVSAMDKTKSVRAAARYLNCSYQHLKKYIKFLNIQEYHFNSNI
jgi:molybdenum-dependent DNA-binding transcriptional regulator ModE